MFEKYLGISTDYIVIGLAALCLLLLILLVVALVKIGKQRKRLDVFFKGKDAKSLEDTLIQRLNQLDEVAEQNQENKNGIFALNKQIKSAFQKYSMLKYDAFEENGGKLSTILVMLDEKNNGYIINFVHGNNGSYTYTKEIIDGNSIVQLGKEEEEALDKAIHGEQV
ncbi:DUF4446 family protein [Lachnospiraceae bacterium YH-ros2228]|jgi:hypothetical protein|nr:DUF4446 family protein [Lachnospiraceae bacterium]MDD6450699.1 DUF4446 family protein [Lachnospiraceae bacterium]